MGDKLCYERCFLAGGCGSGNTRHPWFIWLELAVAVYFVVDCAIAAYQWYRQIARPWETYYDSSLDFTCYVYHLVRAIQSLLTAQNAAGANDDHSESDDSCYLEAGYLKK